MTTTDSVRVSNAVFDQVQVGKTYRFNGRKGKVVAKHVSDGSKSAAGWGSVVPVVVVVWKE